MKHFQISMLNVLLGLCGCTMVPNHDRLGLQGWIAGATQKGHLPVTKDSK